MTVSPLNLHCWKNGKVNENGITEKAAKKKG
jgi:hypothetical protein